MALTKIEKKEKLKKQLQKLSSDINKENRKGRARNLIKIGAELVKISSMDAMLKAIENPKFLSYVNDSFILKEILAKEKAEKEKKEMI
jgi:intein/homing endonuclease